MKRLTTKQRAQILGMMVEGVSHRAIARLTGASKNTIAKLLIDAGEACVAYHDKTVRNVKAKHVQCDEIWSFCAMKEKNVPKSLKGTFGLGDVYTWTAIDSESKLIASWLVGKRDAEYAHELMDDLKGRLANRVQLTTDGHKAYLSAVEDAFGADIDYAMLVKIYGPASGAEQERRYSPAECCGSVKGVVCGNPEWGKISTSHVERQNLSMRMGIRRFTRLTNGFSKKVENHAYAVAIYFVHYNFVRIHQTLRVTPAMEAGISSKLWSLEDIVALVDANEPAPKKRGPYRKKELTSVAKTETYSVKATCPQCGHSGTGVKEENETPPHHAGRFDAKWKVVPPGFHSVGDDLLRDEHKVPATLTISD